jgi:hypothetical protein
VLTSQSFPITAGDYFEIWAKVDANDQITIQSSNAAVQRKPYQI